MVPFMHYDLGCFDQEGGRVERAPNPFNVKVSPMCPERTYFQSPPVVPGRQFLHLRLPFAQAFRYTGRLAGIGTPFVAGFSAL